jgi:hypothetical protein
MQRWSPLALGALVVLVLAALIVGKEGFRGFSGTAPSASSAATGPSAAPATPSPSPAASAPSLVPAEPTSGSFDDLALRVAALPPTDDSAEPAGIPLPVDAPKTVRFGVVLVQYGGAQGSPPGARPKSDALRLAVELAEAAKSNFREAVQRGDSGSTDDAGRMPRGVLEPTTEYAVFTLPKGGVSSPIDTPRGFWIVRRLE